MDSPQRLVKDLAARQCLPEFGHGRLGRPDKVKWGDIFELLIRWPDWPVMYLWYHLNCHPSGVHQCPLLPIVFTCVTIKNNRSTLFQHCLRGLVTLRMHTFTAEAASGERKPGCEETDARTEWYLPVSDPCDTTDFSVHRALHITGVATVDRD